MPALSIDILSVGCANVWACKGAACVAIIVINAPSHSPERVSRQLLFLVAPVNFPWHFFKRLAQLAPLLGNCLVLGIVNLRYGF